ncbi:MAG: Gfo/Idh/MocA family oxidoreductase [Candidatus Hydrogenedentes bacterium]|nr:Gfo/Idh/MocA family oxidoreductase [Candidatus Hydrogenedentota bacterium]
MRTLDRRDFMSKSALALTAATVSQMPSARAAASPNEKVRVGLIGCGGMGRGDLATFFMNPEVDCPVICDIDDAQLAETVKLVEGQRGHTPDTVKDFRRVIDRKDIDVCLVATPDHWHALPMVYACQAGKDVYVEKPLGKSIHEGRAMLEAARQNNSVVQMGTQWRSGTHYREAVEFIQSGKLGKIRLVRAWAYLDWVGGIGNPPDSAPPPGVDYDLWLGPSPKRPFNPNRFHFNFRWHWDYAGGLMTDWGVHLLNICMWAMGPEAPLRVSASGGRHVLEDNTETPDTQVAVYDFPSYTLIFEQEMLGGVGPGGRPHGMLFNGTEGTVIIDSGGWEVIPEPKKDSLEAAKHPAGRDARPAHVRNFLDCIKSREQPVENLEIGHFVSTVAHLGNIALRSQSEIAWDPEKEKIKGNRKARDLVRCDYRKPWKLPYA